MKKTLFALSLSVAVLLMPCLVFAQQTDSKSFFSTGKTPIADTSTNSQLSFPLVNDGQHNFVVCCEGGSVSVIKNGDVVNKIHRYRQPSIYDVQIDDKIIGSHFSAVGETAVFDHSATASDVLAQQRSSSLQLVGAARYQFSSVAISENQSNQEKQLSVEDFVFIEEDTEEKKTYDTQLVEYVLKKFKEINADPSLVGIIVLVSMFSIPLFMQRWFWVIVFGLSTLASAFICIANIIRFNILMAIVTLVLTVFLFLVTVFINGP